MIVINKRPYQLKNSAVCIGKFDGLHRGHQSLIEELSRFSDCNKVLFTFAFSKAPYILSPEEKRTKAEKLGIDTYVECPFDESLKAMTPKEFFEEILVRQCDARVICVGDDFHFGKDHFFIQFTFGKDVFQMFADGRRLNAEQFGHSFLRKPNCFVFDDGVYAHIFFGGLIHQKTKIVAHGSVLSVCLAHVAAWAGRFVK